MADVEQQIKDELVLFEQKEQSLATLAEQLQSNPKFAAFLEAQKSFNDYQAQVWKNIEEEMIANGIKSVKTDKITLTIAERTSYTIDEELLPAKFWKKVPDTTKISGTHKLEGKLVKGTTPRTTKYLVKRGVK